MLIKWTNADSFVHRENRAKWLSLAWLIPKLCGFRSSDVWAWILTLARQSLARDILNATNPTFNIPAGDQIIKVTFEAPISATSVPTGARKNTRCMENKGTCHLVGDWGFPQTCFWGALKTPALAFGGQSQQQFQKPGLFFHNPPEAS